MDRNSIIGIVLIFVVLFVASLINRPSRQQIEKLQHQKDSILRAEEIQKQLLAEKETQAATYQEALPDSLTEEEKQQEAENQLGVFGAFASGEEQFLTLENNLIKLTFSNRGGKIYSVELKKFKRFDGTPLILFDGPENTFGLNFFSQNRNIQTERLFFQAFPPLVDQVTGPEVKTGDEGNEKFNRDNPGDSSTVRFRLEVNPGSHLDYVYTLKYNSYLVGFNIQTEGLNRHIANNQPYLNLVWAFDVPRQEKKSQYGEDRYTNIYYKFYESEVEKLNANKSDEESLSTRTQWIGMKQLFFTSTLIADEFFPVAHVACTRMTEDEEYLARFKSEVSLPYQGNSSDHFGMDIYFGPTHFHTLRQYKINLESQVNLGYSIVRPVNRFLIIPVFTFLRKYISNMGIVILLLTVFIKFILFPFTYKSYISQAKMRVLKPEMDEINAKFPADKAMDKQQAIMALYKKAGVSPMGGCLPMLLQMPILIAMFFFFPTSIELRQQGFLWAHDLSTYDSILNLPFSIPFYGDHVSLFCLLMTLTTIISTHLNSQATAGTSMPGMKTMMYLMPVMFLFILNSYSSGLSYYYFLANVITIGQTYVVRGMVDEDKIRAQIQLNKKKTVTKSKFQQRLEKLAKERGITPPPQKKR